MNLNCLPRELILLLVIPAANQEGENSPFRFGCLPDPKIGTVQALPHEAPEAGESPSSDAIQRRGQVGLLPVALVPASLLYQKKNPLSANKRPMRAMAFNFSQR